MLPIQFKGSVATDWQPWTAGAIDIERFKSFGSGYYPTKINGIVVFSLKFQDGRVWDINQGWNN